MTKRPTLKVCPFCGTKAVYRPGGANWVPEHLQTWNAGCMIGCATSPDQDTKEQAREWWNRRYTGPAYRRTAA